MFDDLVARFCRTRDPSSLHAKIRVATMCSGTESPLLALRKISDALQRTKDVTLEVEHVFSCEIEPFKQAYIERNFAPNLLFRDIRELGGSEAATAYGALKPVPGDVDMLVAGTSCVDYSNLNNDKKGIDDAGESGQTFRGMMQWVKNHKPPIVILENVCQAPWEEVARRFENVGYASHFLRLDTKKYYIPHTRTRVYLVAFLESRRSKVEEWKKIMKSLESPAKGSIESFLFSADDPRLENARRKLDATTPRKRIRGATDWGRCESRHKKFRMEEGLGDGVPLTSWHTGCRLPEHAWNDWGSAQSERVLDLLDIFYLRYAAKGIDATYKSMAWNLSQNVDRSGGEGILGVAPCLTPSMIPYATIRGGPILGLESLSLQGIPVEDLVMTRETETQMKDLSGNAMSTSVVGACMLAALWLNGDFPLEPACRRRSASFASEAPVGVQHLRDVPLNLAAIEPAALMRMATRSRRMCATEMGDRRANHIHRCVACGATMSEHHSENPKHEVRERVRARESPVEFRATVLRALPMKFTLQGGFATLESDFVFQKLARGAQWRVVYKNDTHSLELRFVGENEATWLLFEDGGDEYPIARLSLDGKSLRMWEGAWEILVKDTAHARLRVTGKGSRLESWERSLGLESEGSEGSEGSVFSSYEISGHPEIDGVYDALPKCGGAKRSLHKQRDGDVFFFLDPDYYGSEKEDSFVFSKYHHRVAADERREKICALSSSFRLPSDDDPVDVSCTVTRAFEQRSDVRLVPKEYLRSLALAPNISLASDLAASCGRGGVALMKIVAPLSEAEKIRWAHAGSDKEKMRRFAWLNSQIVFPVDYATFTEIRLSKKKCNACAPLPPPMRWIKKAGQKKVSCREDPEAAGEFEQAMKRRPDIFKLSWSVANDYDLGELIISVDPAALAHRAIGRFDGVDDLVAHWRIVQTTEEEEARFEGFRLLSNREDETHETPLPGWNESFPLRLEQKRSLAWMIKQETVGKVFEEEEVSEKTFPLLNIRAEAKASRKKLVRGGILADQVGFGKTALAVAVIANSRDAPRDARGPFATEATLVLVPSQLMKQWPDEIKKFCPSLRTAVIKTMADLNSLTPRKVKEIDVLVVNTTVIRSPAYFSRLSQLAGTREISQDSTRRFGLAYEDALSRMRKRTPDIAAGALREFRTLEGKNEVSIVSNRMKGAKLTKSTAAAGGEGTTFVEALDDAEENFEPKTRFQFFLDDADDALDMRSPLLEMFDWRRVVVDEFTYLQEFDRCVAVATKADSKWCLSGTPPLAEFSEVKRTATLLGVDLGVDDFSRAGKREMTEVETFHLYREKMSRSWELRRDRLAQTFLDKFARQNIAEIDEIEMRDVKEKVTLSPEERALYLELEQHVRTLDAKVMKKGGGDRQARLAQALEGCGTPEEALVKRCSYYEKNVREILDLRKKQYDECEKDLAKKISDTATLMRWIESRCGEWPKKYEKYFDAWKGRVRALGSGDPDVTRGLQELIREAEEKRGAEALPSVGSIIVVDGMEAVVESYSGTWKQKALLKYEDGTTEESDIKTMEWDVVETATATMGEEEMSNKIWEARELTHEVEKLLKELVSRKRSLRFFNNLILRESNVSTEDSHVLSGCGHVGSLKNLAEAAEKGKCGVSGCRAAVKKDSVLERIRNTVEKEEDIPRNGTKLRNMVRKIETLPAGDKAIVFVQFSDLAARAEESLQEAGVRAARLTGGVHQQTKTLEIFQTDPEVRVLIMLCRSESAAGANLTVANHAIFLHPLITDSPEEYEASETQAVGRVRRYGQKKKVFVWRFVAERTVEVELQNNKGVFVEKQA